MSDTSSIIIDSVSTELTAPAEAPYFAVSAFKLAVMSVCTFGLYELYWFYNNWRLIKVRDRNGIMPFWRAFFSLFFCYQCFSHIITSARSAGIKTNYSAGDCAVGWILITLAVNLPEPYMVISALAFVPMLSVQSVVNELNATVAPEADRNSNYSVLNIVAIIFGGLVFALLVIGTFFPE